MNLFINSESLYSAFIGGFVIMVFLILIVLLMYGIHILIKKINEKYDKKMIQKSWFSPKSLSKDDVNKIFQVLEVSENKIQLHCLGVVYTEGHVEYDDPDFADDMDLWCYNRIVPLDLRKKNSTFKIILDKDDQLILVEYNGKLKKLPPPLVEFPEGESEESLACQ